MKFIRDSCIRIPLEYYRQNIWCKSVVSSLVRKSIDPYAADDSVITVKYYSHDVNKAIMIPRYMDLGKYNHMIEDHFQMGEDIDIKHNIEYRNARQKESAEWMMSNNNGILCLQPGEGKTVVSIRSVSGIKKRTIIFTHKHSLTTQWIKQFKKFSDIGDDICIFESSKYVECFNKSVIIATVQGMCSFIKKYRRDIDKLFRDSGIGMAIWDECHTATGAEQFSKTSLYLPCYRTFGLSATPDRLDGNTDIIQKHIGQIFTPKSTGIDTMTPRVTVIKFDSGVMRTHMKYIMYGGKFYRDRYFKILMKKEIFLSITKKIVDMVYKSDRRMLFLSDRIRMLDIAASTIKDKSDVGFFIPRSKKERDEHLTRRMVFSTYGSARDGTDSPSLSVLVMATPTSNIKQCVGRIVRHIYGKPEPIVVDLVDIGCDDMVGRYAYRKQSYQSYGWKITEQKV